MSRTTAMSGFPEFLPDGRFVEQHVLDSLRRTFELHGFAPVETRAVEPLDQLLSKGETSKEVYVLRRLQADPDQAGSDAGIGLHFDLTVPFARYVLEHAGKLEFPFRRYQIQKVWRGERPQEGRYREFTQADIDIVGRDDPRLPPRRRDRPGDGGGAGRAAGARHAAPGEQPQAHPGLLRRHRRHRHRRRDAGRGQDRQGAGRHDRHDARRRGGADPGAGAAVPAARRDPQHRHLLRGAGARPRCPARAARRGARGARGRPRGLCVGDRRPARRRGRPADRPRAWTTTPAPSSRP